MKGARNPGWSAIRRARLPPRGRVLAGTKRKLDCEPAKGSFWREAVSRCLNRTISSLAREVFYLCTLLPNSALRARPNVRHEGQPGKWLHR